MKKLIFVLGMLFLLGGVTPATAQENSKLSPREQQKSEKQKKKEARQAEDLAELKAVNKLVEDTAFVFVANTLYGPRGSSYHVDPSINFLGVHSGKAVYQFAFNGLVGWNGIGGATFEGDITRYIFKPSDNLKKASDLTMNFRAMGVAGSPYVTMSFFGHRATVSITFNTGERVRLDGEIRSVKDAGVYKGQSLF